MSGLPNFWKLSTIGDVCETVKGKKPKNSGERSGERTIPYINIKAFESGLAEQFAEPGEYPVCDEEDVLIVWDGARSGLIGRGVRGYIGSTLARIMCKSLSNSFLFYFLQSKYGEINSRTKGVGIPHVDPQVFYQIRVPIPPLSEQSDIVAEIEKQFTRLDAGIAALKRVQANLKRYRAAVLKAACEGKLVPTEAELHKAPKVAAASRRSSGGSQSRDGSATLSSTFETGEQLLERILAERRKNVAAASRRSGTNKRRDAASTEPAAPDTTSLPSLPEGWTWASAEQICNFITKGTTPSANKLLKQGEIPFIKVYNLTDDGRLDFTVKPTFISRAVHDAELARSKVFPKDVLMNIVGPPLGKVSIVPEDHAEWNINQAVAIFRPLGNIDCHILAYCLMNQGILQWAIARSKTTAGQHNLTLEICRNLPLPLPPLAEQSRIVAEVERRLSVLEELDAVVNANLQRATRLRQCILQKAFTGGFC